MSYEFRIAARYLWSTRKRLHTAFLSLISTLGLAVGVATLLISLALLSGLQNRIKEKLVASSPHVLIEPVGAPALEHPEVALREARKVGTRVQPYIAGMVWVSNRSKEIGRPAHMRTLPDDADPDVERLTGDSDADRGIHLTRTMAAALRVEPGDEIAVVGPRTRLTPFGPAPVVRAYRSAFITPRLESDEDTDVFLDFDDASALFLTAGNPTAIELWIDDVSEVDSVRQKLVGAIPGVEVKTWKEINRPLFLALRLEKVVMFATISLIVLVAALNLICSLAMLVVEKRSRIGILRTMGSTAASIRTIFLWVGILIGVIGTLLGNVIGVGASWAADRFGLVPFPGDGFLVSHVPFEIDPFEVVVVNLIALALTAVATWYPATIAAKLDPMTAIREE
jgi:lipoprotein-releasing system permease protein